MHTEPCETSALVNKYNCTMLYYKSYDFLVYSRANGCVDDSW